MGLAPILIKIIFKELKRINAEGVTILLVEQNAKAALKLSDYTYVLTTGSLTREGPSAQLLEDPGINEAFLGKRLVQTEK